MVNNIIISDKRNIFCMKKYFQIYDKTHQTEIIYQIEYFYFQLRKQYKYNFVIAKGL